jgi:8-oxo-dGTP pyrophosphatase MutT (NUDIX family)
MCVVAYMRDGRGHALPGGKVDETDANVYECGSREALEEVGIEITEERWTLCATAGVIGSDGVGYLLALLRATLSPFELERVCDPETLGISMVELSTVTETFPNNEIFFDLIRAASD